MQRNITGQFVSQITVQVVWTNQDGSWIPSNSPQYLDFFVLPRKGDTVYFPDSQGLFNVIEVWHYMSSEYQASEPYVIVVLQEPPASET